MTASRHEDYAPLDVSQWDFYVVSRAAIEATDYASIGLPTLRTLTEEPTEYAHISSN